MAARSPLWSSDTTNSTPGRPLVAVRPEERRQLLVQDPLNHRLQQPANPVVPFLTCLLPKTEQRRILCLASHTHLLSKKVCDSEMLPARLPSANPIYRTIRTQSPPQRLRRRRRAPARGSAICRYPRTVPKASAGDFQPWNGLLKHLHPAVGDLRVLQADPAQSLDCLQVLRAGVGDFGAIAWSMIASVGRSESLPYEDGFFCKGSRLVVYYFSTGTTMPRMMMFWQRTKTTKVGMAARTTPAKVSAMWPLISS